MRNPINVALTLFLTASFLAAPARAEVDEDLSLVPELEAAFLAKRLAAPPVEKRLAAATLMLLGTGCTGFGAWLTFQDLGFLPFPLGFLLRYVPLIAGATMAAFGGAMWQLPDRSEPPPEDVFSTGTPEPFPLLPAASTVEVSLAF